MEDGSQVKLRDISTIELGVETYNMIPRLTSVDSSGINSESETAAIIALYQAPGSNAVDLAEQVIVTPKGEKIDFEIAEYRKHRLINGLDDIGITLQHAEKIQQYEQRRKTEAPWLFQEI